MGVDIIGRGQSYNWTGWGVLFDLGLEFGWKPLGTLSPEDFEGEWNGDYFSNDFQIVTAEDAKAWADAITRAVAAKKAEHAKNVKRCSPPWVIHEDDTRFLEKFATMASKGEFALG